jgi:transposase
MPRHRDPTAPRVVHRTARAGLRVTRGQRRRLLGLLASAGDVWACVLEASAWRRARRDVPLAGYQELCRELAASGPGTFGELDSTGARSVLRRYSDAWIAAASRRRGGDVSARFPRRRRALVPVRWYAGRFTLAGRGLRLPVARGRPPLIVRLDRDLPCPPGQIRSVTLLYEAGRLWIDVTAEVPVATYPDGQAPDPGRLAGVDLGIIHPYAVAGPGGQGLLVSGRAIRAECHQHLQDAKARARAAARRAPKPGRRHNQRTRAWRIGHLLRALHDKAEQAGITVRLTDERGTSSTCPRCRKPVPKPAGRVFTCPHCKLTGHRDLLAAASIAARAGGGTTPAILPADVTHRRAGTHLPDVHPARRDPRRRTHHRDARGSPDRRRPAPPTKGQAGSRSSKGEECVNT